jgi:predicted O-methyltransferase YrrM
MKENEIQWFELMQSVMEAKTGAFMQLMLDRKKEFGSKSSMGQMDCALLYALVRSFRPKVAVETGANTGMASSFILKAMHDADLQDAKLYGIEYSTEVAIGSMIPEDLRGRFNPCPGNVRGFMKERLGPGEIDFFLHDSVHRYKHQMWEFKHFWERLRPGGLLVSHDVNMNASFVDFISKTYKHDFAGYRIPEKTKHSAWARWGNLGFIVKA